MKLVCILLLLPLVLLQLPAVEDADDGTHKQAGAYQCPGRHEHRFAGGDEQLAHPPVWVPPWVWYHYQLGVGDDLGETAAQGLRVVSFGDADPKFLHKVPVSSQTKDSVRQLEGMVSCLGQLGVSGLLQPSCGCGDDVGDGGPWLVGTIGNVVLLAVKPIAASRRDEYL